MLQLQPFLFYQVDHFSLVIFYRKISPFEVFLFSEGSGVAAERPVEVERQNGHPAEHLHGREVDGVAQDLAGRRLQGDEELVILVLKVGLESRVE